MPIRTAIRVAAITRVPASWNSRSSVPTGRKALAELTLGRRTCNGELGSRETLVLFGVARALAQTAFTLSGEMWVDNCADASCEASSRDGQD